MQHHRQAETEVGLGEKKPSESLPFDHVSNAVAYTAADVPNNPPLTSASAPP
jgi:hypothetical protein